MFKITKNRFYVVPVLMRTLDILEFLRVSNSPLKMNEIANATRVPSTTTYRILRTLLHRGYLAQDLEGRFSLLNRPEMKIASPQDANPGGPEHLGPHKTDLSGDQVIDILNSVLQTLKQSNESKLDQNAAGTSFSRSPKNLNRPVHHRGKSLGPVNQRMH